MRIQLMPWIGGIVIGVGVTLAIVLPRQAATTLAHASEQEKIQHELVAAQKRTAQLEATNTKLASDLQASRTTPHRTASTSAGKSARMNALASMFGGSNKSGTNNYGAAMGGMMKAVMTQQRDAKVAALKLRLNLTEPQEEQLRAILDKQFNAAGEMAARVFQGKSNNEELQSAGHSLADTRKQINDLLTPEQQTAYVAYLEDERQNKAALMANAELSQMRMSLQLDQNQQEQVYNIVYDQTLKALPADGATDLHEMGNWQKLADTKLEALRGVLTPEQFEAYQKQVESQKQMVNTFMSSFGGSNTHGAGSISVSGSASE